MALPRLFLIDSHAKFRESARKYLLRCHLFKSVETADGYYDGMFLHKKYYPDLLLIDSEIFFENPGLIKKVEELKHSNPALKVLVLFLFREEYLNRCQELFPLVSGIILKESFAEDLLEYLAADNKHLTERQDSSRKGVDRCN
ncbi:MAG: hypothetical protein ACQES4_11005 [Bacillota bacterium]